MSSINFSTKSLASSQGLSASNILAHSPEQTTFQRVSDALIRVMDRLIDHLNHRRTLRTLATFDDRMLSDIGLTRSDRPL